MSKTFKIVGNDISDGYHTFSDLYEHRVVLYLAYCKASGYPCFYREDGDGWFCLFCETPGGQISYHLSSFYLSDAQLFASHSPEHAYDGHKSHDVLARLMAEVLK